MMRVCFRNILNSKVEKRGGRGYYDRVYINFYDVFQYGLDRRLVKYRAPHGFGFVRAVQVRNPYSRKCQKQRDHQYDETNHSAMFCQRPHHTNVSDNLIQCKLVENGYSSKDKELHKY